MRDYDREISALSRRGYQAELYVEKVDSLQITKEMEATTSQSSQTEGYRLRVVKEGKVGYASSSVFEKAMVERAIKACGVAQPDRNNALPPSWRCARSNSRNFNFRIEDSVAAAKAFFDMLVEPSTVNLNSATVCAANTEISVISTEGVDVKEKSSAFSAYVEANYKKGSLLTPEVHDYRTSTKMLRNPNGIRQTVMEKIDAVKLQSQLPRKFDEVVFTPKAVAMVISSLVASSFSGESLFRGITPMKEELDLGNWISLMDDPFVKDSVYNCSFDGEGLPKRKIPLIQEGRVKNFLYNTYWARKASVAGTGSASRGYQSAPQIANSNLVILANEEKDVAEDSLVVDEVLGSHTSDLTTGKFSVTASAAWINGRSGSRGVKGVVVTGNLTDVLSGIESMSRNKITDYGVVTGDLKVKGLSIT